MTDAPAVGEQMTHGSAFLWILGSCGEIFYNLFVRVISMLVSSLMRPFVVGSAHGSLFLSSLYPSAYSL